MNSSRAFMLQKTEPQNVRTTGVIIATVLHVHASTLSMRPSAPLRQRDGARGSGQFE